MKALTICVWLSVRQLHREFLRAGANVMQTFTFYASDDKLVNRGWKVALTVSVCFFPLSLSTAVKAIEQLCSLFDQYQSCRADCCAPLLLDFRASRSTRLPVTSPGRWPMRETHWSLEESVRPPLTWAARARLKWRPSLRNKLTSLWRRTWTSSLQRSVQCQWWQMYSFSDD